MKRILLLMLCISSFSFISKAQNTENDKKIKQEKTGGTRTEMDSSGKANQRERSNREENLKKLDLTSDQQKKLEQMHRDMRSEKEKVKSDASLTEDQKNEKLRTIDK